MAASELTQLRRLRVEGVFILSNDDLHFLVKQNHQKMTKLELCKIPYPLEQEECGSKTTFWSTVHQCKSLEQLVIDDPIGAFWDWPKIIYTLIAENQQLKKLRFECENTTAPVASEILNTRHFLSIFVHPEVLQELTLDAPECQWCIDFISVVANFPIAFPIFPIFIFSL